MGELLAEINNDWNVTKKDFIFLLWTCDNNEFRCYLDAVVCLWNLTCCLNSWICIVKLISWIVGLLRHTLINNWFPLYPLWLKMSSFSAPAPVLLSRQYVRSGETMGVWISGVSSQQPAASSLTGHGSLTEAFLCTAPLCPALCAPCVPNTSRIASVCWLLRR